MTRQKKRANSPRGESEGGRRLGQYGIGDGHGCDGVARENVTGQDMERN